MSQFCSLCKIKVYADKYTVCSDLYVQHRHCPYLMRSWMLKSWTRVPLHDNELQRVKCILLSQINTNCNIHTWNTYKALFRFTVKMPYAIYSLSIDIKASCFNGIMQRHTNKSGKKWTRRFQCQLKRSSTKATQYTSTCWSSRYYSYYDFLPWNALCGWHNSVLRLGFSNKMSPSSVRNPTITKWSKHANLVSNSTDSDDVCGGSIFLKYIGI